MGETGNDRREVPVDTASMPRIEPLEYEEVDEARRREWDAMRPASHRPRQHADRDPDSFRIWMHHPALMKVRSPLVTYLMDSTVLPERTRELAILRSAWRCGADEQWVNHSKIGMDCGLTGEEVDRITAGADAPGWSAEDAAVLRAVDELHDSCRIGDGTWAELASRFDQAQLLELLALVGNYRAISYIQNSVGIRPPGGTTPEVPGNRFLFTAAGPPRPTGDGGTTGDGAEAVLQRLVKGHLEKDLDLVMTCWHPDVEAVHPMRPDRSWRGAETFRRFQEQIWAGDPERHWQVVSTGVVGNRFYLESVTGHKDGTLVPCISIEEVEDGKVVRLRVYTDTPRSDGVSMTDWVDDMNTEPGGGPTGGDTVGA